MRWPNFPEGRYNPLTVPNRFRPHLLLLLLAMGISHGDPFEMDEATETGNNPNSGLPFFRISADIGLALHIGGGSDSGLTAAGKQFKSDERFGGDLYADITLFPWAKGGFGLFYSRYNSDDKAPNLVYRNGSPGANYRSRTQFDFYGPYFLSRLRTGPCVIYGGVGGGFLRWRSIYEMNTERAEVGTDTYGLLAQISLDLPLLRALAVGMQTRLVLATTREYKVNGITYHVGDNDDQVNVYYKSLTRLEASVGLRFGL